MIHFNITDHAIQRYQQRIAPPNTSYADARALLEDGLQTATKLKRRAQNGEDLWHITALGCVAICAPDRYGKAERIVRTVITEAQAQVDSEGYSDPLDALVDSESIESASSTLSALESAKKHPKPEENLPAEVQHLEVNNKSTWSNLNRLIAIAQVDLAATKRRATQCVENNDTKTLLRRSLCAALMDPRSPAGSRILSAARSEDRFEVYLEPVFLRADPMYAEVRAQVTAPAPTTTPRPDASLHIVMEAVRARVEVLEVQAKTYDETATSFPPGQVEALCTYRLLLEQLERLVRGETFLVDRLR